jgi:hypothetical protein
VVECLACSQATARTAVSPSQKVQTNASWKIPLPHMLSFFSPQPFKEKAFRTLCPPPTEQNKSLAFQYTPVDFDKKVAPRNYFHY